MMKGFYFDFMEAPRHLPWMRALLLLAGLLSAGFVAAYYQTELHPQLQAERQTLQAEMAKLGAAAPVSAVKPAVLAQSWRSARQASVQLSLPWQRLFVELGQASGTGNVALISIEPDPVKSHVVLMVEGRDMASMLKFVSDLQKSPDFSEVVLQSHTINTKVPEKPVRFRLSATWRTTE